MNPPRGAKKFLIGRDLHGGLSLPEIGGNRLQADDGARK